MSKILKMICHLLHIAAKTAKFGFFRFSVFFRFLPVFPAKSRVGGGTALWLRGSSNGGSRTLEPFFSLF